MKKLFTLGLMMLFASAAFSQATHTIDFEPTGIGADWDWTVTENGTNPALEFVANPDPSGINTSATVAKFTATDAGMDWALCFTDADGEFTFDNTNSTITIMVHKPVISDVGFKVEGGTGTVTELKVPNTVTGQWEELTFDFSALEGQSFSRLVIIPDFAPRTTDNVIYFDNIQVPDGVSTSLSTTKADNLKIFPNPVEDVLNIQGLTDGEMIEIYSNSGSLIKKSSIEGGSVSVEGLPKGMYFIKIGTTTQKMFKK